MLAIPDVSAARAAAARQFQCPKSGQFWSPMLQSGAMTRWYFGFFFHFPRPLAEENG